MKKIFPILFLSLILCLPLTTHAFEAPSLSGPLVSCSANPPPGSTLPQCKSVCDIFATIHNIISFVFALLLYILAPLMIAIGGLMIAMSGANEGMRSMGRKIITQVVIGAVIALLSFLIVNTFIKALGVKNGLIHDLNSSFECSLK